MSDLTRYAMSIAAGPFPENPERDTGKERWPYHWVRASEAEAALAEKDERIKELEAELVERAKVSEWVNKKSAARLQAADTLADAVKAQIKPNTPVAHEARLLESEAVYRKARA